MNLQPLAVKLGVSKEGLSSQAALHRARLRTLGERGTHAPEQGHLGLPLAQAGMLEILAHPGETAGDVEQVLSVRVVAGGHSSRAQVRAQITEQHLY